MSERLLKQTAEVVKVKIFFAAKILTGDEKLLEKNLRCGVLESFLVNRGRI